MIFFISDHVRTGSGVSFDGCDNTSFFKSEDDLRLELISSTRAHHQPLTCLDCQGGRVLTGSHDHTLRVFRLGKFWAKIVHVYIHL
jgi:hypothetical protein